MSRKALEQAKRDREQWIADMRWQMGNAAGRRFVWNLMQRAGVDGAAMTGNSQTFFILGRQQLMRDLEKELKQVALADFRLMEDEAIASKELNKQIRDLPEADPEE